jgi:preprotein translocase subunit SecG
MVTFITIIHVIVSLVLIAAVLLQSGKSADLAGAFGGGGSQSTFGPRGGQTILSKLTTICAVLFMLTSLGLYILSARGTQSLLRDESLPADKKPAATETTEKKAQPTEKKQAETGEKQPESKKQETQSKNPFNRPA